MAEEERERVLRELQNIVNAADNMLPDNNSDQQPFDNNQSLDLRKSGFIQYIENNISKLKIRVNILRFKYTGYKSWFDKFNVSILCLSAGLTLLEAIRARFGVNSEDMDSAHTIIMGLVPIIVSSMVTLFSALIKFKRYEIKMQSLQAAIQKAIFTTFRLKRIQENAKHLTSDEELETLIEMYSGEPYDLYIQSQEEMEKLLRYEDLVKHMKTYYDLSLEYEQSEMNYKHDRLLLSAQQQLKVGKVDKEAEYLQNKQEDKCCIKHKKRYCLLCCGGCKDQDEENQEEEKQHNIELTV